MTCNRVLLDGGECVQRIIKTDYNQINPKIVKYNVHK
jgi:hypothetical protein